MLVTDKATLKKIETVRNPQGAIFRQLRLVHWPVYRLVHCFVLLATMGPYKPLCLVFIGTLFTQLPDISEFILEKVKAFEAGSL